MSHHPSAAAAVSAARVPATGTLPGCVSLNLARLLLLALPRPLLSETDLREHVFEALELVRLLAPRDRMEAMLAVQIVLTMVRAPASYALAAAQEGDVKMMHRCERMAMAYERRGAVLRRQLVAYRKGRGVEAWGEPELAWAYDVAAMTAGWCAGMREMVGADAPAAEVAVREGARPAAEAPAVERGLTETAAADVSRPVRRAEERRTRKLREQAAKRAAMLQRIAARAERMAATAA